MVEPDEADAARAMMMNIHQAGAAADSAAAARELPIAESRWQQEENDMSESEKYSSKNDNDTTTAQSSNSCSHLPAAVRPAAATAPAQLRASTKLDFADTIEGILSSSERRKDNNNAANSSAQKQRQTQHGGMLKDSEIHLLSMLCTQQTITAQERKMVAAGGGNDVKDNGDVDLGFADVEVDLLSQLVEVLEHHIVSATRISLIEEAYRASQNVQRGRSSRHQESSSTPTTYKTMDEVRKKNHGRT